MSLLLPLALGIALATAIEAPAPPAPRAVVERHYGVETTDPYRYFEDANDAATQAYFRAQGEYARAALAAVPGRELALREVLQAHRAGVTVSGLQRAGTQVFYLKTEAGADRPRLMRRDGLDGAEHPLFDPRTLDRDGALHGITAFVPSPDGRHVALALAQNDAEIGELRVLETATGRLLAERIEGIGWVDLHWLPDSTGFYYPRLRDDRAKVEPARRLTGSSVYLHLVGTPVARDERLLGPGLERGIALPDNVWPALATARASRFVLARAHRVVDADGFELFALRQQELRDGTQPWRPVVRVGDKVSGVLQVGDTLYARSALDAPNYKLLALDLAAGDLSQARTVLPAGDAILEDFAVARDGVYVHLNDGGSARLLRIPRHGGEPEAIALPFPATLSALSADPERAGAVFRLTSWVESPRYYTVEAGSKRPRELALLPKSPVQFDGVIAVQVEAISRDGTRVPLSIVRHRDAPLDGRRPTFLRGYGAYGISQPPAFWPFAKPLLDRRGVFAVCHVRGGGERGEAWHRAGMLLQKQNSFDDFVACIEYLHRQRYSSPQTLAISGGSAGGILIGRVLTQRPELMRAAILDVPLADMLRMEQQPNGPNQTPEFGSVKDEAGFRSLHAMSPYAHVESGKHYPAVMIATGLNDARVAPWQSAKLAARLQAATASGRPVLLRVDGDTGHGVTVARNQFAELIADHMTFAFWQFGIEGFVPAADPAAAADAASSRSEMDIPAAPAGMD